MNIYNLKYILLIALLLFAFNINAEDEIVDQGLKSTIRDYTPDGFVRQPSFVQMGGNINKNEHALIISTDMSLIPLPILLGYRYGLVYWWDIGFDIGGNYGVFQALIHTKMEIIKTRKSEFFFWGVQFKTGYKYNVAGDENSTLYADDESWVNWLEHSLAFRIGSKKDKVIYYANLFYWDIDLRKKGLQTDFYFAPVILGFETMLKNNLNFFIEVGYLWTPTGMQVSNGDFWYNDRTKEKGKNSFIFGRVGVAFRTGDRTAIYYTRESRDKAKLKP